MTPTLAQQGLAFTEFLSPGSMLVSLRSSGVPSSFDIRRFRPLEVPLPYNIGAPILRDGPRGLSCSMCSRAFPAQIHTEACIHHHGGTKPFSSDGTRGKRGW